MDKASDAVALAEALIACESVTPARGPVFDALEAMLDIGFSLLEEAAAA
jgi:succinyl-diaminopimelate desuccinylase